MIRRFFILSIILASIVIVICLGLSGKVLAQIDTSECESKVGKNQLSVTDAERCGAYFEKQLSDASSQKKTLQSEISKFNAVIALTSTKIITTTNDIKKLESEIADLSVKIGKLDLSLDQVTAYLINRIVETYKIGRSSSVLLMLTSANLADFTNRAQYIKTAQLHDRDVMYELESVRTNFEDQKIIKEEKQVELETAKKKLESQKILLAQQKSDKESLLIATQGSEQKYQQLLSKALAEIASLKNFTQKQSGGILPAQNSPDGWFYSQRDERWAKNLIGYSSENIIDVGCLISSIAMIFTHYGQKVTPADIAANSTYFFGGTAYMKNPWPTPSGKTQINLGGMSDVDNELAAGRPVIVHLGLGGDGHFVVLKKKDGSEYIMHDPWHGYDKKLSDYYSVSLIDKRVVYR